MNQKLDDLSVNDELKEMDSNELNERLTEITNERNELESNLEPYNDDIEEDNYDGDSIEIVTDIGECNSQIDEVFLCGH